MVTSEVRKVTAGTNFGVKKGPLKRGTLHECALVGQSAGGKAWGLCCVPRCSSPPLSPSG